MVPRNPAEQPHRPQSTQSSPQCSCKPQLTAFPSFQLAGRYILQVAPAAMQWREGTTLCICAWPWLGSCGRGWCNLCMRVARAAQSSSVQAMQSALSQRSEAPR